MFILLLLAICLPVFGQRRPAAGSNQAAKQATAAREAGRLEEAIELYRKAVSLNRKWGEGWWYLATLLYDRDRYGEAAAAFKEAAALQPKSGTALAMLGLCEYQLGLYDEAYGHIAQGRQIGLGDNRDLNRSVKYHAGLLQLLRGEFETAQQVFGQLAFEGLNSQNLILALGLAALRMPLLPKSLTPDRRDYELVRRIGWAEHQAAQKNFGDAQTEYDRVAADFGKTPNVHYAHGRFLLAHRDDETALAAFQREVANSPAHALARLQIAYIKLKNKDAAAGLPFAEEAARLHPRMPLAHYILGRLYFDVGENDKAISSLEEARGLAPEEPKVYFSLSRAYARANRKADADKARETFARLNKLAEEAAQKGMGRGEAITEPASESPKPNSPDQLR